MSILETLTAMQRDRRISPCVPGPSSRIGFAFSTKERVAFTRRVLEAMDHDAGYDLVWCDGSDSPDARALPSQVRLKNARLAQVHHDVRGGPDAAICFGLRRLLEAGYDYCGLLENDIVLAPGWFGALTDLFRASAAEGLAIGAATVRNVTSRVMEYRTAYSINWNIGAGMILFTREAAQLLVDHYDTLAPTARRVFLFYAELCGVDLRNVRELWFDRIDRRLSPDWGYDLLLYQHGLATVGSIPGMTEELEPFVHPADRFTQGVTVHHRGTGIALPTCPRTRLTRERLVQPLFTGAWWLARRAPWLHAIARAVDGGRVARFSR